MASKRGLFSHSKGRFCEQHVVFQVSFQLQCCQDCSVALIQTCWMFSVCVTSLKSLSSVSKRCIIAFSSSRFLEGILVMNKNEIQNMMHHPWCVKMGPRVIETGTQFAFHLNARFASLLKQKILGKLRIMSFISNLS